MLKQVIGIALVSAFAVSAQAGEVSVVSDLEMEAMTAEEMSTVEGMGHGSTFVGGVVVGTPAGEEGGPLRSTRGWDEMAPGGNAGANSGPKS